MHLSVLFSGMYIAPPYHDVRVTVDPPVGPFHIGSSVTLQCSINPPPPERVTYSWSTSIPSTNFYINQPNLTITIPTKHPNRGHYYCTVSNGSTEIGVGSTSIDIKGKLEVHILPQSCCRTGFYLQPIANDNHAHCSTCSMLRCCFAPCLLEISI